MSFCFRYIYRYIFNEYYFALKKTELTRVKRICFTVNNELNYDQRMIRICTSLAPFFKVTLVGRYFDGNKTLVKKEYRQRRIHCWFRKGKLSYLEHNLKLLLFLLFTKTDCFCAIDLDTIVPVLIASKIRGIKRIYDAHELFTELKEVVTRPVIKKIWDKVERLSVPHFRFGYTVSDSIAKVFFDKYGVDYMTIRNLPLKTDNPTIKKQAPFILYQGAVNEGRCLEYLIPAMAYVNCRLIICGDGNFMKTCRHLVNTHHLADKVVIKGMLLPEQLKHLTLSSYIGVNLVEPTGLNQIYSLANKFFDYIHAGIPQLTMKFPEYEKVNNQYKVALLTDCLQPADIALQLNLLLQNTVLYNELQQNCLKAKENFDWQSEEKILIGFYHKIFKQLA